MCTYQEEQDMQRWRFRVRPGMPRNVQKIYNEMSIVDYDAGEWTFIDDHNDPVRVPTRNDGKPYFAIGYARALWDLRNRNLALELQPDDAGTVLFRRDIDTETDENGQVRRLHTWHAISAIADEYRVPRAERNNEWENLFIQECRRLKTRDGHPWRVVHGIRFDDRAYWREDDGKGHQHLHEILDPDDPLMQMPFELNLEHAWDDHLADVGDRIIADLTADANSRHNMMLLPASPFLQPYKHLTFVLAGDGGNGKGLFFSAFTKHNRQTQRLSATIDTEKLVGGGRLSGTSVEQEPVKLVGKLWAFDEDASGLDTHQTDRLKRLSTGDTISGRILGSDVISFNPRAVLCIATNLDFVTNMDASMKRRFAFIRMKDNRSADSPEMVYLRTFVATVGAWGFIMASCRYWQQHPDGKALTVQIGRPENLSEAEEWIVAELVERGFADNTSNPFRPSSHATHDICQKLGLKTARRRNKSVLMVNMDDEEARARFQPYAAYVRDKIEQDGHAVPPEALRRQPDKRNPDEYGFACDYTPAGADKVARNWQKLALDPGVDTSRVPQGVNAWAAVPAEGYAVLDFDVPDDPGAQTGWAVLSDEVGAYGSMAFPATFVARTPGMGAHAYYRLPKGVVLRNTAHPKTDRFPDGLPIDVRTARKGYVIAPGSTIRKGQYLIADAHEVVEMSAEMVAWLDEHGYVEHPEADAETDVMVDSDGVIAGPANTPAPAGRRGGVDPLGGFYRSPQTQPRPEGGNRGETMRLNVPAQSKGATHDAIRDWSYGLIHHAAEERFSQPEVDALVERIKRGVRVGHDRHDTALVLAGALKQAGLSTRVPLE